MKKILFVVALVAIGHPAYTHFVVNNYSRAYAAYERYSNALLYQKWEDAMFETVVGSQAESFVKARERQVAAKQRVLTAYNEELYKPYINKIGRTVHKQTVSADGEEVNYDISQFTRESVGMDTSVGPPRVKYTQKVRVVRTDDGEWAVELFLEKRERLVEDNDSSLPKIDRLGVS